MSGRRQRTARRKREKKMRVAFRDSVAAMAAAAEEERKATEERINGRRVELRGNSKLKVRTHSTLETPEIESFEELLDRPVPLVRSAESDDAFELADYCRHSLTMLRRVIEALSEQRGRGAAASTSDFLSAAERAALHKVRALWNEHLRCHKYSLWNPPPASGGVTAEYSLAVQLWLLVAHANVVLQLCGACGSLFEFYPPESAYLSRNALVLDNAPIMRYPLRTLVLTLQNFVETLDSIDRLGRDYARFATALEHRTASFICFGGTRAQLNAGEWCTSAAADGTVRVSEAFLTRSMIWFSAIYDYAENWCVANSRIDAATQLRTVVRVPAHCVEEAPWRPSLATERSLRSFVCRYARELVDDVYVSGLRDFLRQFQLGACEMDIYRQRNKLNEAHITSVRTHKFADRSDVAHAYVYHVYFDRNPIEYVSEVLQWEEGDPVDTRSASLGRSRLLRGTAVLYIWHQFLLSKFKLEFKRNFLLFHRDPAFMRSYVRARTLPYPVIVQQFGRWSVLVPDHEHAAGAHCPERVYDCRNVFLALGVWVVWLLHMTRGKVDRSTNLRNFLHDVCGASQIEKRVARADRWFS